MNVLLIKNIDVEMLKYINLIVKYCDITYL